MHVQQAQDGSAWEDYVGRHPGGLVTHRWGLCDVIERVYGHRVYRLVAFAAAKTSPPSALKIGFNPGQAERLSPALPIDRAGGSFPRRDLDGSIIGLLPLVHIRHPLFGNSLVSMPFFDRGGIVADNPDAELALAAEAWKLAERLGCRQVELRGALRRTGSGSGCASAGPPFAVLTRSHKVRMVMPLPDSADGLMKSFKSKLRSQLNKPLRDGLTAAVGGGELIDDFYRVFAENMRDLGSPVHSKRFIADFVGVFPGQSKIFMVYKGRTPLSGAIVNGFKDALVNPWASSRRAFNRLNPNMFLYWSMLKHACEEGFKYFDFGRSTPGEGTYKFKAQWGAQPQPLPWNFVSNPEQVKNPGAVSENSAFELAGRAWRHLPVGVTRVIGPQIRKYISL